MTDLGPTAAEIAEYDQAYAACRDEIIDYAEKVIRLLEETEEPGTAAMMVANAHRDETPDVVVTALGVAIVELAKLMRSNLEES